MSQEPQDQQTATATAETTRQTRQQNPVLREKRKEAKELLRRELTKAIREAIILIICGNLESTRKEGGKQAEFLNWIKE